MSILGKVSIDETYWQKHGLGPNPDMRTRILYLAVDELASNGPEFFDTSNICKQLFIARSLVNHHFGNHLNLIVEAAVVAYESYVLTLHSAAKIPNTPEGRLEAWMLTQAHWFARNRGIAVILQMPHPKFSKIIHEKFAARMQRSFRFNMTVLGSLVRGVFNDEIIDLDFNIDDAPYEKMMGDDLPNAFRTGTVGMSSLGSSVWTAGRGEATRDLPESYLEDANLTQHIRWVIQSVSKKSDNP